MQETVELAAHSFNHARSAMSSIEAADAAREIDQPVAVHIFDDSAFRFRDEDRRGMICRLHHSGVTSFHQLL
jgi:hypothetical protein